MSYQRADHRRHGTKLVHGVGGNLRIDRGVRHIDELKRVVEQRLKEHIGIAVRADEHTPRVKELPIVEPECKASRIMRDRAHLSADDASALGCRNRELRGDQGAWIDIPSTTSLNDTFRACGKVQVGKLPVKLCAIKALNLCSEPTPDHLNRGTAIILGSGLWSDAQMANRIVECNMAPLFYLTVAAHRTLG
jgi:hypothetical protein